jgi:hypothetical protein
VELVGGLCHIVLALTGIPRLGVPQIMPSVGRRILIGRVGKLYVCRVSMRNWTRIKHCFPSISDTTKTCAGFR